MREISKAQLPETGRQIVVSDYDPNHTAVHSTDTRTIVVHFGVDRDMDSIPGLNHWVLVETPADVKSLMNARRSGGCVFMDFYDYPGALQFPDANTVRVVTD